MLSIKEEKINSLFAAISKVQDLYLPVENASGNADFAPWTEGVEISKKLKTVRSAKDFFFPKVEHMVSYQRKGIEITVEDPRKELKDFTVFGVRACDAASFGVIDEVYLKMDPVDSYYKNRRDHGTVITLACSEPANTCFCSAYKIDASDPKGDISAWLCNGTYYFQSNTDKGTKLLDAVKGELSEADEKSVNAEKDAIHSKIEKLPLSNTDLTKIKNLDMIKMFNSKVWDDVFKTCLGCGTCTFVCPTCMCFDVRDFDTGNGIKQYRCWDSCMHSDFTQMAAENPRHTQKERFRQRFMHKLKYYPMAHEDKWACVGCGRCLENCPINMSIVKVIKAFNESEEN